MAFRPAELESLTSAFEQKPRGSGCARGHRPAEEGKGPRVSRSLAPVPARTSTACSGQAVPSRPDAIAARRRFHVRAASSCSPRRRSMSGRAEAGRPRVPAHHLLKISSQRRGLLASTLFGSLASDASGGAQASAMLLQNEQQLKALESLAANLRRDIEEINKKRASGRTWGWVLRGRWRCICRTRRHLLVPGRAGLRELQDNHRYRPGRGVSRAGDHVGYHSPWSARERAC